MPHDVDMLDRAELLGMAARSVLREEVELARVNGARSHAWSRFTTSLVWTCGEPSA